MSVIDARNIGQRIDALCETNPRGLVLLLVGYCEEAVNTVQIGVDSQSLSSLREALRAIRAAPHNDRSEDDYVRVSDLLAIVDRLRRTNYSYAEHAIYSAASAVHHTACVHRGFDPENSAWAALSACARVASALVNCDARWHPAETEAWQTARKRQLADLGTLLS